MFRGLFLEAGAGSVMGAAKANVYFGEEMGKVKLIGAIGVGG